MKTIEKLTNKLSGFIGLPEPSEMSAHERRGSRVMAGYASGVLALFSLYPLYKFGVHVSDIESIMPFTTTSTSNITEALVEAANFEFATLNLAADTASAAVAISGALAMNGIRKRCSEDLASGLEG